MRKLLFFGSFYWRVVRSILPEIPAMYKKRCILRGDMVSYKAYPASVGIFLR